MRTKTLLFGLLALAALALAALWWRAGGPAPAPGNGATPAAVPLAARAAPVVPVAPMSPAVAPDRQPAAASDAAFASFDEEGEPIAAPVRDGLVLWVCSPRGVPAADVTVTAHWRKGWGLYGKDVGRTDGRGRLATTVAEVEQFEGVEVQEPKLGTLGYWDDLLPTAEDPRTVQLVVPDLAPLRIRVVDGRGAPVAGSKVTATGGGTSVVPRQYLLRARPREASTDASGATTLLVAQGSHEIAAAADACSLPQTVWAEVGPGGGDATLVLLRDEHRIDVTVRVTTPPGHAAPLKVDAFTRSVPDRTGLPGRGGEGVYRELFVDRQGDRTFVVRAEGLPWRWVVKSEGCATGIVDVPARQTEVQVGLLPAAPPPVVPKARLVVTVLDPDGEPTSADVRVHETPDLVYGSDRRASVGGRLVLELEPKGRVCLSASSYGFARCVAGPFELAPGEQHIELRLLRPLEIRGRVVDAAGRGVECNVCLRRPAGALRGLAAGVPEILADGPTRDHRGTLPDGAFQFGDCGPGDHELIAFPADGRLPARRRVPPGATVTLVLGEGLAEFAIVRGTVRDAVSQAPVAGADLGSPLAIAWSLRSDADGRFQFPARPGELRLRVRQRGYVVSETPPLTIGTAPVVLDVALPPSPVLFVHVLDAGGRPLAGAEVSVLGADGEPIDLLDEDGSYDGDRVRTNEAGRADLRGAPAGPLRLQIEHDGRSRMFDMPATAGRKDTFDVNFGG